MLSVCRQTLYNMRKDKQIAFGRLRGRAMVPMAEIKRVHAQLYPDTTEPIPEPERGPGRVPPKPKMKKIQLNPQHS